MAKVAGAYGTDSYRTSICDWFERDVEETFGNDDMEFEVDGRKGFAGSIAEHEDEYGGGGSMFGDTKAHQDTKIRVLLAISRYLKKYCPGEYSVKIIVGQPVKTHKDSEKQKIKDMLIGHHNFKVNGHHKNITIEAVEVATEGGGAFWSNPNNGTIRVLDIGSGTVNAVTTIDKKFVNNKSDTFNFGVETIKNRADIDGMARGIIRSTTKLKWHKNDRVYVCGGIAEEIAPFIAEHFVNSEIIYPQLQCNEGVIVTQSVFSNAVGFYNIARGHYK